jgi:hypothetical protein
MQIVPYLWFDFRQNIHLLVENGSFKLIQNDLDEKQLRHKVKRGPSKSQPNSFQVGNLEGDI